MRTPEEIRKIFKNNTISGYRLEKDLGISQVGADKFLNGETKKPYKSTLEMYNSYIDNGFKVVQEKIGINLVQEEQSVYLNNSNMSTQYQLNMIYNKLDEIEGFIKAIRLKMDIEQEIAQVQKDLKMKQEKI